MDRHGMLRWVALIMGCFAIAAGLGGLLGWVFDVPRLIDWDQDGTTIKTNTTIGLFCAGLALFITVRWPSQRMLVRSLAVLVAVLGTLTLFENLTRIDLGIDNLLIQEAPHARATVAPNRMGLPASSSFMLLGTALWLITCGSFARLWALRLGIGVVGIASLSLMSYIYGADQLYALPYVSGIALQTACVLAALGVGVMASIPEHGVTQILLRDDAGGMLLRRLLPAIVLVPLVLGWVRVRGQEAGHYDTAFGTAAFALAVIIIFSVKAWWTAARISRLSREGQETRNTLQRRERDLSDLFDNASIGLHWVGPDGIILRVNRNELDMLGHEEHEYLGHHIAEFHADKGVITDILARLVAGETLHNVSATMVAKDGSLRDVIISSNALFEDGHFIHTRCFTRDVTREKHLASVLGESEQKFRMMFETAPMGMTLTRMPERVFVDVNESFLKLIGYTKAEVIGRTAVELGIVKDAAQRERRLDEYQRTGKLPSGDVEMITRDGSIVTASIGVKPITVSGVDLLMTIVEDITERKQAEEALRESEERIRLATDTGRVGTWEWNILTDRITWSDVLYDIQGVNKESFGGGVADFTNLLHPDDRERVGRAVERSLNEDIPYELDFRAVRPSDGTTIWLHTNAQVLRDDQGKPLRMVGAVVDMTRQKQDEHALREADRRKDEFIATLAHELRNPLAPLRSGIQVLLDDPKAVRDVVPVMERQVEQMVHLIDDLMDLSRISRGAIELRREPLDLSDAVALALETMDPKIRSQRHGCVFERSPSRLPVLGDMTRLTQVFTNLLDNAVKYSAADDTISVRTAMEGGDAVVAVRDNGIGLDHDQQARVFDIFSQVHGSSTTNRSGLGIGLHIVKRLVEMHGGTVEVTSEGRDQGSSFTVRLPLTDASPSDQPARPVLRTPGRSLRVMLVDDNEDGADLLAMIIKKNGHETAVHVRAAPALENGAHFRPHVVLLDIGMPEMDGYEACRLMRATTWGAAAHVIALTGWGQESDRVRAREAGFDDHLVKPIDARILLARLNALSERITA